MLGAYRTYYGPDVNLDTPVKIIHFDFIPLENNSEEKRINTPEKEVVFTQMVARVATPVRQQVVLLFMICTKQSYTEKVFTLVLLPIIKQNIWL